MELEFGTGGGGWGEGVFGDVDVEDSEEDEEEEKLVCTFEPLTPDELGGGVIVPRLEGGPRKREPPAPPPEPHNPPLPILPPDPPPPPKELVDEMELCFVEEVEVVESRSRLFQMDLKLEKSILVKPRSCSS